MKKSTILSFLTIAMLVITVTLSGCGDEDDPQPTKQKTNLEKVQDGVIGTWTYVSAQITKDGVTTNYTSGECGNNTVVGNVAVDVDYVFGTTPQVNVPSNLALTENQNCTGNSFNDKGYRISQSNGTFIVTIYSGANPTATYTIITPPDDIDGNTVKVKSTLNGAERIVTYQKQ